MYVLVSLTSVYPGGGSGGLFLVEYTAIGHTPYSAQRGEHINDTPTPTHAVADTKPIGMLVMAARQVRHPHFGVPPQPPTKSCRPSTIIDRQRLHTPNELHGIRGGGIIRSQFKIPTNIPGSWVGGC